MRNKSSRTFGALSNKLQKEIRGNFINLEDDPRSWYPELDDKKNGEAIIRFLSYPDPLHPDIWDDEGQNIEWVIRFVHSFDLEKGNMFVPCPTTVHGRSEDAETKCPICEHNRVTWKTNEQLAITRGRQKKYATNVLIVEDKKNPENEGQVRIFLFGQQLMNLIVASEVPEDDEILSIAAWDMQDYIGGANFHLKICQRNNMVNYDYKSKFVNKRSNIVETKEEIQTLYDKCHDLEQFFSVIKYKTYDEIAKDFYYKLGEPNPNLLSVQMPVIPSVQAPVMASVSSPDINITEAESFFDDVNKESA